MSEHTPLPWQAKPGLNRWNVTTCENPRTFNICAINTDRIEQEANAAFIVKACNSHYKLLEALKRIERIEHNMPRDEWEAGSYYQGRLSLAQDIARTAIEAAEKKP